MCGYLGNVIDSPLTQALMLILGVDFGEYPLRDNPGSGPAASIDIVLERDGQRIIVPAVWWLLLNPSEGLKPSRYTSFNTRSDKLNVAGSAGAKPFRTSRCVIPATYIIEGEGTKGARRYHRIEPTTTAFALGGLYKEWVHPDTGQRVFSCSVITLAPHPRLQDIHSKSTPLFLPIDPTFIDRWLSPVVTDVTEFAPLLQPSWPEPLRCTPIERPGNPVANGDTFDVPPA